MNQIERQNLQTLSQLTESRIVKKITQLKVLLLSVSVFSLLLSNYSFAPSFLHSFNFYLSTLPVQLFTHTLDKNYIFLLCNGLLVFVAKYSGFITSLSRNTPNSTLDQSFNNYEDAIYESKMPGLEDELVSVEHVDGVQENIAAMREDKENECVNNIGQTEDREIEELIVEEEGGDDDEEDGETGFLIIGKEGEHESELSVQGQEVIEHLNEEEEEKEEEKKEEYDDIGEGNGVLSTEEMNKKFEEFIRKMKEEIRIEAQQQLVMVN